MAKQRRLAQTMTVNDAVCAESVTSVQFSDSHPAKCTVWPTCASLIQQIVEGRWVVTKLWLMSPDISGLMSCFIIQRRHYSFNPAALIKTNCRPSLICSQVWSLFPRWFNCGRECPFLWFFFFSFSLSWICVKFRAVACGCCALELVTKIWTRSALDQTLCLSQNNTLAAAGLNTESWREQDANHVILSPASLHLTSIYHTSFLFFLFRGEVRFRAVISTYLALWAHLVSDGAVSYLNELWLTEAWPSLELESGGGGHSTQAPVQPIIVLQILNQAVCRGQ